MLLEDAIRHFFIIGYNILVTFAFQPYTETKLERIQTYHFRTVIGSSTHFIFNGTQQAGLLFRGRTSRVENSQDLHVPCGREREQAGVIVRLSIHVWAAVSSGGYGCPAPRGRVA